MTIMASVMEFKIQHLQAAVALVLASFQPQPKAVACQPAIVERVYEMAARVNKTDIKKLTAAFNTLAGDCATVVPHFSIMLATILKVRSELRMKSSFRLSMPPVLLNPLC